MSDNLLPELLLPEVDEYELLEIIQNHYKSGQSTPEDEVVYPSVERYSLKIRCKGDHIATIEPGPGFDEAQLSTLKERVQTELIESPGTSVAACILFSSRTVQGAFRSTSDRIQILPAPQQAPRPGVLVADHPFILEFPFERSQNGMVTTRRRIRGMLEWTWILNTLLRANIKCIGPRHHELWVLCPEAQRSTPSQANVKWTHEFYNIDNFAPIQDEFTPESSQQIPHISHDDYYGAVHLLVNDLVIPDSLSHLVDRVANLSADSRRRFVRAAQWIYTANEIWLHHTSSSYIALVAAIESIAHGQTSADLCPTCGKDRSPGPTQRFQDFVERYSPRSVESETNKRWLYSIRSDLAHGRYLLQYDETAWGALFTTTYLKHNQAYGELLRTVRQVMVNWLRNSPVG